MARKSTGVPIKKVVIPEPKLSDILPKAPEKKSIPVSKSLSERIEAIDKEVSRLNLLKTSYLEGAAFQADLKAPFTASEDFKVISES